MPDKQSDAPVIVWFRQDLRLADNPALRAAAKTRRPVVPVYILDETGAGKWALGGASRWWLHHSLAALGQRLSDRGARLVLRRGGAREVLAGLVEETGATQVVWNRCYEPAARSRDEAIEAHLRGRGVTAENFNAALLHEPWTIETKSGRPYTVFTPFWKACLRRPAPPAPLPAPRRLRPAAAVKGERLESWNLLPRRPNWAAGFEQVWTPGEAGATRRLNGFVKATLPGYAAGRDRPDRESTSRLSPHLHWGEIGPRQVWHAVAPRAGAKAAVEKYLSEVGWREFSYHLLYHVTDLPTANLQKKFNDFPWRRRKAALRAWQRGKTGYPIVDAGMRELWTTGWMHNRVRMIVASFLVKHLLLHWRAGARWFWDTLVDADLANNSASWQWVAGCGADAAPYFRIFNPVLQGERYDPQGAYVRRWVPEIAGLPDKVIHKPWQASEEVLLAAGVVLGKTYPKPLVDHAEARAQALEAFKTIKG